MSLDTIQTVSAYTPIFPSCADFCEACHHEFAVNGKLKHATKKINMLSAKLEDHAFATHVELSSFNQKGKAAQAPIVRSGPKVGPNDPCPCASGKKFKKCCENKK
jgi:uncharacterized protein YecA (UPF0149 family)